MGSSDASDKATKAGFEQLITSTKVKEQIKLQQQLIKKLRQKTLLLSGGQLWVCELLMGLGVGLGVERPFYDSTHVKMNKVFQHQQLNDFQI